MNSTTAKQGLRLSELDGLRAISILLVLAGHMLPLGPKVWHLNFTAPAMGMSLFFALSGFLITSTLLNNPSVKEFLIRRLARILPLYFLYLLLIFFFWDFDVPRLIWSALFVTNYVPGHMDSYNSHLWSLCVEMHFYLAIALGVALLGKRAVYFVWPACLAVTFLRVGTGTTMNIATHLRVDEILAGACIATIYYAERNHKKFSGVMSIGIVPAAAVWIITCVPATGALQYLRPYGSALVLAAAIWSSPTFLRAVLSSRPARYVAEISYALYVVHPATVAHWMNEGSIAERYFLKRPISFALTFALAHLSTFYWESIWRKKASSYLRKRKAA